MMDGNAAKDVNKKPKTKQAKQIDPEDTGQAEPKAVKPKVVVPKAPKATKKAESNQDKKSTITKTTRAPKKTTQSDLVSNPVVKNSDPKPILDIQPPQPPVVVDEKLLKNLAKTNSAKSQELLAELVQEIKIANDRYKTATSAYSDLKHELVAFQTILQNPIPNQGPQNQSNANGTGLESFSDEFPNSAESRVADRNTWTGPAMDAEPRSFNPDGRWSSTQKGMVNDLLKDFEILNKTTFQMWERINDISDQLAKDHSANKSEKSRLLHLVHALSNTIAEIHTKSTTLNVTPDENQNGVLTGSQIDGGSADKPTSVFDKYAETLFKSMDASDSKKAFSRSVFYTDRKVYEIRQKLSEKKAARQVKILGLSESKNSNPTTYKEEEAKAVIDYVNKLLDKKFTIKESDLEYTFRLRPIDNEKSQKFHKTLIVGFKTEEVANIVVKIYDTLFREQNKHLNKNNIRLIKKSLTLVQRQAASTLYKEMIRKNKIKRDASKVPTDDNLERIWIVKFIKGYPVLHEVRNRFYTPYIPKNPSEEQPLIMSEETTKCKQPTPQMPSKASNISNKKGE